MCLLSTLSQTGWLLPAQCIMVAVVVVAAVETVVGEVAAAAIAAATQLTHPSWAENHHKSLISAEMLLMNFKLGYPSMAT